MKKSCDAEETESMMIPPELRVIIESILILHDYLISSTIFQDQYIIDNENKKQAPFRCWSAFHM